MLAVVALTWSAASGVTEARMKRDHDKAMIAMAERVITAELPPLVPLPAVAAKRPATKPGRIASRISDEEICLGFNIFHEARDQPRRGRVMVGMVTMNRVLTRGSDVCREVFRPMQFSWTFERPYINMSDPAERAAFRDAIVTARSVISGEEDDELMGAVQYYNPSKVTPQWRTAFAEVFVIGDHRFMRKRD